MYLIKQASEISGVSVRTLHHYDEIGLLRPKKQENGYRYYAEEDMSLLQTVLFYKYLGFSLKQIKELLKNEEDNLLIHLKQQLNLMQKEKDKLLTLIETLESTIRAQERRTMMSTQDKFKGFRYHENDKYKQAAIDKYGKEVIENAIAKQKGKEEEITDGFNQIFFAFAENMEMEKEVGAKENVDLAEKLHQHLCQYSFDCSLEVFSSIGYGYAKNEEFRRNLDQFGKGTAQYVCDAIQKYVAEKMK